MLSKFSVSQARKFQGVQTRAATQDARLTDTRGVSRLQLATLERGNWIPLAKRTCTCASFRVGVQRSPPIIAIYTTRICFQEVSRVPEEDIEFPPKLSANDQTTYLELLFWHVPYSVVDFGLAK